MQRCNIKSSFSILNHRYCNSNETLIFYYIILNLMPCFDKNYQFFSSLLLLIKMKYFKNLKLISGNPVLNIFEIDLE